MRIIPILRYYDKHGVNLWTVIDNSRFVRHQHAVPTMAITEDNVSFVAKQDFYTHEEIKRMFPKD